MALCAGIWMRAQRVDHLLSLVSLRKQFRGPTPESHHTPRPRTCRHLTESKIVLETKARELGIIKKTTSGLVNDNSESETPTAGDIQKQPSGIMLIPDGSATPSAAVIEVSDADVPALRPVSFWTTLLVLWEFKCQWILIGTASTWFLIDGEAA